MTQTYSVPAEVKEKILVFIQNNPWADIISIVKWWIGEDKANTRRDARMSVHQLLDEGEIVKRTSKSVRGLTGEFVIELHSKDGL